MSTRRLIALALACGLAILVAGGVWLVLAGRGSDDDLVASFLPEGATAQVGGLVVGVVGSRLTGDGLLVLDVQMTAGVRGRRRAGAELGRDQRAGPGRAAGGPVGPAASLRRPGPPGRRGADLLDRLPTHPDQQASQLVAVFGREGQRASWELAPDAA